MTLPNSRDATFAAGTQWLSATANRIQDCIVQQAHDTRTMILPAIGAVQHGNSDDPGVAVGNGYVTIDHVAAIVAYMACPMMEGERIRSWEVHCNPGNATGLTVRLRRIAADGTVTTVQSWTSSATGWQKTSAGALDHAIVADSTYYFVIEVATTPSSIAAIHVLVDKPLV